MKKEVQNISFQPTVMMKKVWQQKRKRSEAHGTAGETPAKSIQMVRRRWKKWDRVAGIKSMVAAVGDVL